MCTRSVILRVFRASLLPASLVTVAALCGCRAATPAHVSPDRPVSPVLGLPSAAQIACSDGAGVVDRGLAGRRDVVLGAAPVSTRGPSLASIDVRSDQWIVNGRVYGNLRWRARSSEVRGR
jgi:hypothetical protein